VVSFNSTNEDQTRKGMLLNYQLQQDPSVSKVSVAEH